LWPRAQRAPRLHAIAGGNSGSLVVVVPAIPGLAFEGRKRRLFGGGWTDFFAATGRAAGSGNAVAAFSFHGGTWPEAEHDHRIQSGAGAAGAGGDASAGRRVVALHAGNAGAAACGRRSARHERVAPAGASAAGTE